jgi:DNA polymerase III delta subunit
MLYVFLGTDRQKARAACSATAGGKGDRITRISDANSLEDLKSVLTSSRSMFGETSVVILDGISSNEEMRVIFLDAVPALATSADHFYVLEEKPDAELKKKLQKYAESVETFDAVKKKEYPTVFKLADHLKKGDKKNMWIAYQRELSIGNAPEAIHGVLFWAAKQMLLAARAEKDIARGKKLITVLAALPHEARRSAEELEYALERFVLSFT